MSTKPEFHGDDKAAAIVRAKKVRGMAIYSLAPGSSHSDQEPKWGYWSDGLGMIRTWEQEVDLRTGEH